MRSQGCFVSVLYYRQEVLSSYITYPFLSDMVEAGKEISESRQSKYKYSTE